MSDNRPHCVVLIGKPAVGKSTMAQEYAEQGYKILSGDEAIEHVRQVHGYPTVDGVYPKHKEEAAEFMLKKRAEILDAGDDLVIDFLNLSVKNRNTHLNAVRENPHDYRLEAVVLHPPEHVEYMRRLKERAEQGKTHGTSAAQQMEMDKEYEAPSKEEGFEVIREVGNAPQKCVAK